MHIRSAAAALAWLLAAVVPGTARAADALFAPGHAPWLHLVYEDAKAIASVRTEVRLTLLSPRAAGAELLPGPATLVPEATSPVYLLTAEIRSDTAWPLPDKAYRGSVWFTPGDGAALQRIRERLEPERYWKAYRYGKGGVRFLRAEPGAVEEVNLRPEHWSATRPPRDYPYPADRGGCGAVGDPALLLVAASDPGLGQPRELCVFNRQHIVRARITPAGTEGVRAQYALTRDGVAESVDADRTARVLQVTSLPVAGAVDEEPLELLGIEGDLVLLVDPESGLPLRIRGHVDDFGRADFRLTAATLAASGATPR